jgi:hypothetical protein
MSFSVGQRVTLAGAVAGTLKHGTVKATGATYSKPSLTANGAGVVVSVATDSTTVLWDLQGDGQTQTYPNADLILATP